MDKFGAGFQWLIRTLRRVGYAVTQSWVRIGSHLRRLGYETTQSWVRLCAELGTLISLKLRLTARERRPHIIYQIITDNYLLIISYISI